MLSRLVHIHHIFPKGGALGNWFTSRGIDPNNPLFLTEIPGATHMAMSTEYCQVWTQFMTRFPNASPLEIIDYARRLATMYNFQTFF